MVLASSAVPHSTSLAAGAPRLKSPIDQDAGTVLTAGPGYWTAVPRLAARHRHRRAADDHHITEHSPIRTDHDRHRIGAVRQPDILSVVEITRPHFHPVHPL